VRPEDVPDGPLLIDTDVFSWITWQRRRHTEFGPLIRGHLLALSFATVAELRQGAIVAGWGDRRREQLEDRISHHYVVLTATDGVTARWAELSARLRDRLRGGGVNDMWIAACALSQPQPPPVVTGNLADFAKITAEFPQLRLVHPDL
jgi:predicted nucleic acid-binding protein